MSGETEKRNLSAGRVATANVLTLRLTRPFALW